MTDDPRSTAQRLSELLRQQLACYQNVLALSRQQREQIAQNETSDLMDILTQKQRLIGEIDTIEKQAAPLKDMWQAQHDAWPADVRAPVEEAIAQLRETLKEIVDLENEGKESLGQATDEAGKKISSLQRGKAMNKAYGQASKQVNIARFKDKNA